VPRSWGATRRHKEAKRTTRHRKQAQAPSGPPLPMSSLRPRQERMIAVPSQQARQNSLYTAPTASKMTPPLSL